MSLDLSRFAVNQITTPRWSMPEAIEGYRRHGVSGIGIWRDKVLDYGPARTARHLRDAGMWVACFCATVWMNQPDAAGFAAAVEENRRVLDAAAQAGAPNLVLVSGGVPAQTKDLLGQRLRIRDALAELKPHADGLGIKIGIEPIHPMYTGDRTVVSTIAQANDLILELGDTFGLVADVYHCWWDPRFEAELERIGAERILTFHYCDWLVPTRSWFDRGMVGDGVIDVPRYRRVLDRLGYVGPIEIEIFSDQDWWLRDPDETVRVAIERCGPLVGRAPLAPAPA